MISEIDRSRSHRKNNKLFIDYYQLTKLITIDPNQ